MIRVAIVDDNISFADQMKNFISRYSGEKEEKINVSFFRDGIFLVENYRPVFDIIFMDIQMKMMDGLCAAEKIRKLDADVIIVFVTNYAQYAIQGYSVKASNYVLKPVSYFDFSAVLKESIDRIKQKDDAYIIVRQPGGLRRMKLSGICYIESSNHTIIYHTEEGIFEERGTLKEMEKKLKDNHFSKCNSCYLVNLKHVNRIELNQVFVNNDSLAISRSRKKAFLEELTSFIGGSI